MLKTLKPISLLGKIPATFRRIILHGLIIVSVLAISQMLLETNQNNFMLYLPPIGFALFLITSYVIQPLIIGITNVLVLCRLNNYERCQIGFWLNGLFLVLTFSTINLLLLIVWNVAFTTTVAIAEVVLLSIPFGFLGKFSNRGRAKQITNEPTPSALEKK